MVKFKNNSFHSSQNTDVFSLPYFVLMAWLETFKARKPVYDCTVLIWMDSVTVETDQCSKQ